jgi:hypothetical protein
VSIRIQQHLAASESALVLYAGFAAFMTYLCMYAARKPFSALAYSGMDFFGWAVNEHPVSLKVALGVSQVIGYFLSKLLGTKICSEVHWQDRRHLLNGLLLSAIAALALFWVLPGPWKFLAMFLNGLPLGMVWGLVVGYLEGRRRSEVLLAVLSVSFIVGSGIVKDVGKWLVAAPPVEGIGPLQWLVLAAGVLLPFLYPALAEACCSSTVPKTHADGTSHLDPIVQGFGLPWEAMPLAAALLFLPCFMAMTWLLKWLPLPTPQDEAERTARRPMDSAARWAFFTRFLPGLALLLVSYFLLTAYRDYQDYFGEELFRQLGYADQPAIFSATALPVALGVLAALALLSRVRSNFWGLAACFGLMLAGMAAQLLATVGFQAGWVNGTWWMVWVSLGAYLAYVPFGSVIFDRVIAQTRFVGTAVYAIYLADATGYLGTILIKLYADFVAGSAGDRLGFFLHYTWVNAGTGLVCFLFACLYFLRQKPVAETLSPQRHNPVIAQ